MSDALDITNTTDEMLAVEASNQEEGSIPLKTEQQRLEQFFSTLYKVVPPHYYTVLSAFAKLGESPANCPMKLQNIPTLAEEALAMAQRRGYSVYFRPSVLTEAPKSGRGTEKDAAGSSVLYVDLDYYNLGLSQQTVLDKLEQLTTPPSIVINSGRGIQCYWLLDTFYTDIPALKVRNKGLAQQLKDVGADDCSDLARILRLPFSFNQKTDPPTQASIVVWRTDRCYSHADFPTTQIAEAEVVANVPDSTEEDLPSSFLDDVKKANAELYSRIWSEDTAIAVGAETKTSKPGRYDGKRLGSTEAVDRSKNDWAISCGLLNLGYTPGQVLSVLQHPVWFSGDKFRDTKSFKYVNNTVHKAVMKVKNDIAQYFTAGKTPKFDLSNLVKAIQQDVTVAIVTGSLWHFERGVFKPGGEKKIRTEVLWRLGDQWKSRYRDEVVEKFNDIGLTREKQINQHPGRKHLDQLWVNTLSGLVNLGTRQLKAAIAEDLCITQLPVYYDPKATCPTIDRFLAEIIPHDSIQAVWEYAGYCLLPDLRFRKALLTIGEKRSGKSTLLELLMYFYGTNNVTNISLQDLCDTKFSLAQLVGKFVNIYADLDTTSIKNPGQFKMLIAGDRMKGEHKFKDEFYFYPGAGHIYSANDFTPLVQPDDAYADRWLVIRTQKQFHEKSLQGPSTGNTADIHLIEKLTTSTELSGMFNHALEGLQRLIKNECFSVSSSMKEAHDEMQASIDSVFAFLTTKTRKSPQAKIKKRQLLDTYKAWCHATGRYAVSDKKFFHRVKSLFTTLSMSEGTMGNYSNDECYIGRELCSDVYYLTVPIPVSA